MNILLWLVQLLLAAAFGMAGFMKSTQPVDALVQGGIAWASQVPLPLVRFIGISELAGAIGLILPAATEDQTHAHAARGAGASHHHDSRHGLPLVARREPGAPVNMVLGGLAAFVAWGRTKKAPIRG